jgi:hypothetical protein
MGFFGDLFEELGHEISGLLDEGKWITLKNGKRVKLNNGGRIVAGLPVKYQGVHVADFGRVSKEERDLLGVDCEELAACHDCKETFTTKDHAFRAILDANPGLMELKEAEFGRYDRDWLSWQRGGRKGPKPRTDHVDGRFDAINEEYNLRGANRVASFTEAIYHAIPHTRRWKDLEKRLPPLEEATGITINLPVEALKLSAAGTDVEECRADIDRRIAALFAEAQTRAAPSREEAPF